MSARNICGAAHGLVPVALMVVYQTTYAGMTVLVKMAAEDGMNLRIFTAYRFIFAAAFLAPLAFIFEHKKRPKLTKMALLQAFLAALFGGLLAQNLYAESLALTSATFVTAMNNLIPAVTFIMAISFRLEVLGAGTLAGKAKIFGTVMGISGAMLMTFYKGLELNLWSTHVNILHHRNMAQPNSHKQSGNGSQILGSILALVNCITFSLWLITQAKLSKIYPSHYSGAALVVLMGAIQCLIAALATDRNWSRWKLGWNIRLIASAYSGIVSNGICLALIHWCMKMRGPVFVSSFIPLSLVLVVILGSLVLQEQLYLGSLMGALLIVCGLYMVLWGKSKEITRSDTT